MLQKNWGGCIIITNCDKSLLQFTTANLSQITTILLQTTAAITYCDNYYKLRRNMVKLTYFCIHLTYLLCWFDS